MSPEPKGVERTWTPRWVYHAAFLGESHKVVPYCTLGGGPANLSHPPEDGEILMPVEDHLAVLGEAEKKFAAESTTLIADLSSWCERAKAAEEKLNLLQDEFDREKAGRMAAEERLQGLREGLGVAIDAGQRLATHTYGRSENREVAEAKEQLQRARTALDTYSVDEGSGG